MSLSRLARVLPTATRALRLGNTRALATMAAANPTQSQQQQSQQQGQDQQQSSEVVRREDRGGMTRRSHRGDVFSELERDMNQMMNTFMSPFSSLSAWSPFRGVSPFDWNMPRRRGLMDFDQLLNRTVNINLEEKDNEYVMTVQAPGLKKEELDINVDNGILTISGAHEERQEGRKGRETTSYVSFQRSMTLPEDINQDNIKAEYDDKGNLCRVHLPKVPETERKQRGKIPIESTPSA